MYILYFLLSYVYYYCVFDLGSEHQVDGRKFPLEIHLVHKSNDGILTVLGFLFKVRLPANSVRLDLEWDLIQKTSSLLVTLGIGTGQSSLESDVGHYQLNEQLIS